MFEGFNKDIAADILGGIMVHSSGDIYATIAPDLWRLRDTNGDGILDWQESISHGYSVHPSFSGHDMSALTQGPDGMIYWKIGEIGMNVVDKTGKRWATRTPARCCAPIPTAATSRSTRTACATRRRSRSTITAT